MALALDPYNNAGKISSSQTIITFVSSYAEVRTKYYVTAATLLRDIPG